MTVQFGGPGRLAPDGQVRLMTKVAYLYHEQGIRQTEIARTLNISQSQVSRLLTRAAKVGIVRTTVVVAQGLHTDLEQRLESRYGLLEAVVVDAGGQESELLAALGSVGASLLEQTLTGGDRIGISSWSQTLLSVVDRMRPVRAGRTDGGATSVVQLVGGVGEPRVQAEANRLLGDLAGLLDAKPIFVPAPGLVGSSGIRASLLADPAMDTVSREWADLSLALVGIGSLQPSPLLRDSGNAIADADQRALLAAGAVGDICHRFFDAEGRLVDSDLNDRVVGIDPETLRAVPRRVGIAGSDRKHEAVRAALAGGWVNVIITDVATARRLLDLGATDAATA